MKSMQPHDISKFVNVETVEPGNAAKRTRELLPRCFHCFVRRKGGISKVLWFGNVYSRKSLSMAEEKNCIVVEDDFPGYPTRFFNIPPHYESDLENVLLPRGLVVDRTARIAKEIFSELDLSKPLLALCVLKGGYIFFNDLMHHLRQLGAQSSQSCQISVDFIRLKSYQGDQSSGAVKVIGGDDLENVRGKNVLIVEDIIDTGRTMQKLLEIIEPHGAKSVKVATMLLKRTSRSTGYIPDHIGFEVPDKFVVGFGLDYNEYFRDLGHICIVNDHGKKKYAE